MYIWLRKKDKKGFTQLKFFRVENEDNLIDSYGSVKGNERSLARLRLKSDECTRDKNRSMSIQIQFHNYH